jgi:hypothetical protein
VVKLQGKNSSQIFIWTVNPADKNTGGVSLKFDEQGQTHVLRTIQYGYLITGQLDRKSGKVEDASAGSAEGH